MKKVRFILSLMIALGLVSGLSWGQEVKKPRIVLLIAEQKINAPSTAWWSSQADLSATESVIARKIIEIGWEVIEPGKLKEAIRKNKAYRALDLSENDSLKLGNLSKADYIAMGKAVASRGGLAVQPNARSCFANLSVRLIRVKDRKVIAYLDAAGNSANIDVIAGGGEALAGAANNLAPKLIEAVTKQEDSAAAQVVK